MTAGQVLVGSFCQILGFLANLSGTDGFSSGLWSGILANLGGGDWFCGGILINLGGAHKLGSGL